MKALILAGGMGKRLRPLTEEIPKPLVSVHGKPIIVWQIELLKRHGINEIVFAIHYRKEKVVELLGSGSKYGIKAMYVAEDEPLGTGGAIKNAEPVLKNEEKFVVMNGDIITNLDVSKVCEAVKDEVVGAIALVPLPSPYGVVVYDPQTLKIKVFKEKPKLPDHKINAGVYCLSNKIFEYLPERGDIERLVFPQLAEKGLLKAVPFENVYWKSVDTMKDLEEVENYLKEHDLFEEG